MATKKKTNDYARISVYFNLDEPDQQKIYNLLQAVGRKKTAFLTLMATSFAAEYANTSVLEPENLKVYLKHPSLLKDVSKGRQHELVQIPPVAETTVSAPDETAPSIVAKSDMPEPAFAKQEPSLDVEDASDFDEERASSIMTALSAFTV